MIELTIDNRPVQANAGETVLQVALNNGIDIPHFCYHPCLSIAGNCRVCLVKIDDRPKLMPSCNLAVTPGMKVDTCTEDVLAARQAVMQFITLNHPGDCGICDKAGECRVQDYQVRFGEPELVPVEPRHRKPKLYELSPRISLDNERCILCSRCVRFTREVSGSHLLGIVERGSHSRVARLDGVPFDDPYSDNIISICPTGALLSRDFLYKSRVWYLEPVRSVCTGCARCCSVNVWRRKKNWHVRSLGESRNRMAYRITPAVNQEINGHWLCNKGFDLHQFMGRPRYLHPQLRGCEATVEEALGTVRKLLAESVRPAALLSAHASNEELDAFREAFGGHVQVYTRRDYAPAPHEVPEDDFLIRGDKNPNSHGLLERFQERAYDPAGGHDLLIVWGDQVDYAGLGAVKIIHLASFAAPQERPAEVLIPLSVSFERSGSFSNFEGKLNHFDQVFDKPKLVQHAAELFRRMCA